MNTTAELYEQTREAMQGPDAARAHALASNLCRAAPDNGEYEQMAGVTALATECPDEAREHFGNAVRLAPAPPFAAAAWSGMGHAALLEEDLEKAEQAFRRALSLETQFPAAFAGLGEALLRKGQYKQAEQALRRAIALGLNDIKIQTLLAQALLGQEKLDEAEAAIASALAMDPEAPRARFSRGTLAKVRGRLEDARAIYREVLSEDPEFPGYGQLAELKTFTEDDADIALMLRCLERLPDNAPASVRADLHFALAKAFDDTGDFTRAGEHLHAGNRQERTRISASARAGEARMERIAELFTREFVQRHADAGFVGVAPVFIVSLPRSGSSLMEQMLASHSQITGGGEIGHFAEVATALSLRWGQRDDFPEIDPGAATADLREAGREYARLTAKLRLLTPRFTDKNLVNFNYIGLIRMMLPEAGIVHMRRHPLAVALGVYRQRFARGIGYSFDLAEVVRHYRAYARLMNHWRATVPQAFIEVFHEALVADPERELRRVSDYLGLEFEPQCLEFHKLDRPVRTASAAQVREPLNRRGLMRHEHYRELLAPVAEGLGGEIAAYEHELETVLSPATDTAPH